MLLAHLLNPVNFCGSLDDLWGHRFVAGLGSAIPVRENSPRYLPRTGVEHPAGAGNREATARELCIREHFYPAPDNPADAGHWNYL